MSKLYGLLAEFETPEALLAAVQRVCGEGYRLVDAYTPFPVEGLAEALGFHHNRVPLLTLLGGIVGGTGGYLLQFYSAVIDFPINSGGRPLHSWPAFIPVTFELTVLGAALAAFLGMLLLNGLPRLHHPLFEVREFDTASRHRFFLCIRTEDPLFDGERTGALLADLHPIALCEVPR